MSFAYLPHAADLRAMVQAPSLEGVYEESARLVRDALVGASRVRSETRQVVDLPAADEPERLFRFVRELLFLFETDGFLPVSVDAGPPLTVHGDRFDERRHVLHRQIKALTRHEFVLERDAAGFRAVFLFDL